MGKTTLKKGSSGSTTVYDLSQGVRPFDLAPVLLDLSITARTSNDRMDENQCVLERLPSYGSAVHGSNILTEFLSYSMRTKSFSQSIYVLIPCFQRRLCNYLMDQTLP